MSNEPLNTAPIQQFINKVKSADASQAKELRLDIQSAKRLAFTLGEVMARLNEDLEKIIIKNNNNEDQVIQISMDAGSGWK